MTRPDNKSRSGMLWRRMKVKEATVDRLAQPPQTKDKGPKPGFDVGIGANACVTLEREWCSTPL